MKILFFVLLLAQLLISVLAFENDGSIPNLVTLTEDNFDQETSKGSWILDFYAPWCGHCKVLAPVLADAARTAEQKGLAIKFGTIDATVHSKLRSRFDIRGYPTLLFYRDGESRTYRNPRTKAGLLDFAAAMTRPAVTALGPFSTVEAAIRLPAYPGPPEHRTAFVFLGPPGEEQAAFERAAARLQGIATFFAPGGVLPSSTHEASGSLTLSSAVQAMPSSDRAALEEALKALEVRPEFLPVVAAVSPGMSNKLFAGPFDDASLRQWLDRNKLPLVATLSPINFNDVMTAGRPVVLLAVDDQARLAESYINAFLPVAAEFASDFVFATFDGTKFGPYLEQFGIERAHLPTMVGIDYEADLFYVDEELREKGLGLYDAQEQERFLTRLRAGEIPPKSTTTWYSIARYKRILERWAAGRSEWEVMVVALCVMLGLTGLLLGGCYWVATHNDGPAGSPEGQEEARARKEAEERVANMRRDRARAQDAVDRVRAQRADRATRAAEAADEAAAEATVRERKAGQPAPSK